MKLSVLFLVQSISIHEMTGSSHADLLLCSCCWSVGHCSDFMTRILLIVLDLLNSNGELVWQQKQRDVTRREFTFLCILAAVQQHLCPLVRSN